MAAVMLDLKSPSEMVGVIVGLLILVAAAMHSRLSGRPFLLTTAERSA
jgi:hypothetical protein